MGFFDDIVKAIDKVETSVDKAVKTLEQTADKPSIVLEKAEGGTTNVAGVAQKLSGPEQN